MAGTGIKGGPKYTPDPVKDPASSYGKTPSGNGKVQGPKYTPDMPQDSTGPSGGNPFKQAGKEKLPGIVTNADGITADQLTQNLNSMEFMEKMDSIFSQVAEDPSSAAQLQQELISAFQEVGFGEVMFQSTNGMLFNVCDALASMTPGQFALMGEQYGKILPGIITQACVAVGFALVEVIWLIDYEVKVTDVGNKKEKIDAARKVVLAVVTIGVVEAGKAVVDFATDTVNDIENGIQEAGKAINNEINDVVDDIISNTVADASTATENNSNNYSGYEDTDFSSAVGKPSQLEDGRWNAAQFNEAMGDLTGRLGDAGNKLGGLGDRFGAAAGEIAGLGNEFAGLGDKFDKIDDLLGELGDKLGGLGDKFGETGNKLGGLGDEYSDLLNNLGEKLGGLGNKLGGFESLLGGAESWLNGFIESIQGGNPFGDYGNRWWDNMESRLDDFISQLEGLGHELDVAGAQFDNLNNRLDEIKPVDPVKPPELLEPKDPVRPVVPIAPFHPEKPVYSGKRGQDDSDNSSVENGQEKITRVPPVKPRKPKRPKLPIVGGIVLGGLLIWGIVIGVGRGNNKPIAPTTPTAATLEATAPATEAVTEATTPTEVATEATTAPTEAHEHVWEANPDKKTEEATCDHEGTEYFICTCGETKTEDIPKTEHVFGIISTDGSCTNGLHYVAKCSGCGLTQEGVMDPAGHTWSSSGVYISNWSHQLTCTVCGATTTESHQTDARGHCSICGTSIVN